MDGQQVATNIGFYGVYRTRNETASKALASVEQKDNHFPPSVTIEDQTYSLDRVVQTASGSQRKSFAEFCKERNIITEVDIYS